jgi:predicted nuclease with TOPRIM domain
MSKFSDLRAFKRPTHVEDDASAAITRQKHEIEQLKKEMLEKDQDADAAAAGLEQMAATIEEKEEEIQRLRLELFKLRLSLNNRNGEYVRLMGKMQGYASCSQRLKLD